tara:strand:- start:6066 stop:7073 length:1008 start_codon:yes stop_codon:yes gene_type:complete
MSQAPTNWVFMGSDTIALPALESLYKNPHLSLKAVFTQPDRPQGRGKKLQENAIKTWAKERNLPIFQPEKLGKEERSWLQENQIQWALVMAYGQYIPSKFLATPNFGVHNLHSSLLPAYRGASPIETAIAMGDARTGTTLMKVIPEMDAGPMLDKEELTIEPTDTGLSLRDKIAQSCVPLVERNIDSIITGQATHQDQDPQQVTYARKLLKEDGWLDFNLPASTLQARTRAFSSWPGSFCNYKETRLKVGECSFDNETPSETPGTVVGLRDAGLAVSTQEGTLIIHELQRPGGKMLPVKEFLKGFPIPEGNLLQGKENLPLVSKEPFGRDFPATT